MKRTKKIYNIFLGVGVTAVLLAIKIPCSSSAAVLEEQLQNWPFPCYQGNDLKQVREWEETWADQKINYSNIDKIKEFLSDEFYNVFKNPKDWGTDNLWFTVIPYEQILPTPGQIVATKKYAPTAQLDPNPRKAYWKGGVSPNEFLMGWNEGEIAGFPFPFPKSGVEIVWNLESVTRGDTKSGMREGMGINPKTKVARRSLQSTTIEYFTGRVDVPPVSKKPENTRGLRRGSFMGMEEPLEVRGLRYIELRYLDVEKPEDIWVWFPAFRRIRRLGISFKSDTMPATDMCPDDEFGWNGHVNVKEWKIIGRKEMLMGRHVAPSKYTKKEGQSVWSGQRLERVNVYVIEAKWKDPETIYSKELLFIDPEMWRCLQKITWDREGKVWRQFFYHTQIVKSIQGIVQPHCFELYSMDIQKKHGTPSIEKVKEIGQKIPNGFWTIQNLQKLGY
jgi:hypothetical protein